MKTITLSGKIEQHLDDWYKIKLLQEDGYKIDLVSRFMEIKESYPDAEIQVNYWLSDKPVTKEHLVREWVEMLYGKVQAEYEKNAYRYSSYTSGVDYDTTLMIGKHNLYNELMQAKGMYIIMQINIKQ